MEKKYTSEEHDRCKRVAEAFQELYDLYGDMCMVDAGEFGFVHLLWFWEGNFDSSICYRDSRKMFDNQPHNLYNMSIWLIIKDLGAVE